MVIKKYQANSESEAIVLAKEELGKDAIVMNIKTIKPRGIYRLIRKPKVEITAAVDDSKEKKSENKRFLTSKPSLEPEEKVQIEDKKKQTSAIEEKLNSLQQLLEDQMLSSKKEESSEKKESVEQKNNPCIPLIRSQLMESEVKEEYVDSILEELEHSIGAESSVDTILSGIYQKIVLKIGKPVEIKAKENMTNFVFFIGPTGVGKTTTIAKIASSMKLNQNKKVAMVTMDTYRIAAVEQLRTYANILSVPLKVIYGFEELETLKEEFAGYDIVFIDTAGRSHKNMEQVGDIYHIIDSIPKEEREIYLVVSATTKYKDLVRIIETYADIPEYRLLFTKLDETTAIGNILNIRMLTNASLSYATCGQNVPDDIGTINPQDIAKQLLGGS